LLPKDLRKPSAQERERAGGKILVRVTGSDVTSTNLVEELVELDSGTGPGCH
jgi:hypothetical protein